MTSEYLGYLHKDDPLYEVILRDIQPQLNMFGTGDYRVYKLSASNNVYIYEETYTGRKIIGKYFYKGEGYDRASANRKMEREYANLIYMRNLGFDGGDHYSARPLGKYSHLGELLIEEHCYGQPFSSIIKSAIDYNDDNFLYQKLSALAFFLNHLHNQTAGTERVDFTVNLNYASKLADTLFYNGWTSPHRNGKIFYLFSLWESKSDMWSDCQTTVHGDATPENFLFGDGMHVVTFDLERLHRNDRLFDLGRTAAELSHFFMLYTGNRNEADRFIGHFLWEYCRLFPDRNAAFASITKRLPFYMGINFLRIARNKYFDWNYRQLLINSAMECLKGGLNA